MKLTADHVRIASDLHELEGEDPDLQYFTDLMAIAEGIGKLVGLDVEVLGDKKYSIPRGQWEDFQQVYFDAGKQQEARKLLNKLYGVSGNEDLLSPINIKL